ncbi:MAG: bifunctional proline dehydrogenase/L-glutamate gamma-semialdehyde dehydrogenase [Streptosporangiales bacterium]|nr:bifunctional proline dehydrogenase/L-glutamate gamma-semialdehyde dehydrogenase [Streptosporangiales bacterium]
MVEEQQVERLVRQWLADAASRPADPAARHLAAVLKDPKGLEFTVGFIDRVIRPEDPGVAARALRELAAGTPRFLPPHLRAALKAGALAAPRAPRAVIPVVRAALRRMVGHLLIDATDARLGKAIAKLKTDGTRLNINLLGEAVLGEQEARRRLDGTRRLLERPDVDYVSMKVSAAVPPHPEWAFTETVARVTERLIPLYRTALERGKFINLDMEEYRDLGLTIEVFTRILDQPEFANLEAGIVLQAYLPDALSAMSGLQDWAARRRAAGGAPVKVRLVKGANLPMEHVEAELHGWPLATWPSKQDTDTNYKRVLRWAMTPERTANVRLGVAGHNLFDVAYAWLLAGERGVREGIDFEMLLGMAPGQAAAVRETVGGLLLYTPVVHPGEFDVAISYLVRRLEEGSSSDNFMSALSDLSSDETLFARERDRFRRSLEGLDPDEVPVPRRRPRQARPEPAGTFANTQDTDPSVAANRVWAARAAGAMKTSTKGEDLVREHTVSDAGALAREIDAAVTAGKEWGARTAAERAAVLRRAAVVLEERRGDLLEVMGSECGKTLDQSDPEVSEAIDFANYYAHLATELDQVDGAACEPVPLTVVTPPWNFPVAIPAGGTLAALATGSAVIIKPAPQARRCGSLIAQALWDAGVPRDALRLVHADEGDLGRKLIEHPAVGRVILTGAFETASLFRTFRPDLNLLAETSGKNGVIVTPQADLDLAVKDLVYSAFGHAGQKCSAASLGILVGSVADSRRFRDQLTDAVTSLKVGDPGDPSTQVGPLIEPPSGKLLTALTTLEPGESWLVRPRRISDTLWSPGVKTGVRRGSAFHRTEYFGPVLGLITARDLDEAIAIQNETDYGLTAGLHSLDRDEITRWLDGVQAGNLYVNRHITGAIVRRQPFGGWKKSSVGAGTKAGGPSYLIGLTDWHPAPSRAEAPPEPLIAPVRRLLEHAATAGLSTSEQDRLHRAAASDARAWAGEYGQARDVSGLEAERNVLRYFPVPVWIRYEGGSLADLLRVVAAGLRAGAPVRVSAPEPVPGLGAVPVHVHGDDAWRRVLADLADGRVRLIGGSRARFAEDSGGRPDIALYAQPVTESGRLELLPFLREQAVSVTAHRFGSPTSVAREIL